MTFYAYMLRCSDNSLYTGHTDDLERRLQLHLEPGARTYTSLRLPVKVAWTQEFPTRLDALQAERQIKGWSRAKKEALIRGDWSEISRLARSRPSTGSGRTEDSGRTALGVPRPSTGSGRTDMSEPAVAGVPRPSTGSGRTAKGGSTALGAPRPLTGSGRTAKGGSTALGVPRPSTGSGRRVVAESTPQPAVRLGS
jgi:predicted GIY-YIG superfamily endonuclease